MTTILHDLYRAGLRGVDKTPQTSRVMSYIMAHAPGTTAKMWRRAMFGYLAHGVTMINLYEFRPELASYTENYVDDGWGLYGGVRQALSELTTFEDIVQDGRVAYGNFDSPPFFYFFLFLFIRHHFSHAFISSYATPHLPGDMLYAVPMLVGCCSGLVL